MTKWVAPVAYTTLTSMAAEGRSRSVQLTGEWASSHRASSRSVSYAGAVGADLDRHAQIAERRRNVRNADEPAPVRFALHVHLERSKLVVEDGKVKAYRSRLKVSFKYEGGG